MGEFNAKNIYEPVISIAEGGIIEVEAKLHKINVSGDYKYPDIENKLGPLKKHKTQKKRYRMYDQCYIRRFPCFYLYICVNPNIPGVPYCYIEIHPKEGISAKVYKVFLIKLSRWLPELSMSRVEYTLDQYCETPEEAERLFLIEAENLYVPYQRKPVRKEGRNSFLSMKKKKYNQLVHFGVKQKIYERGADVYRKKKRWPFEKVDRVRLEFTAKNRELKKYSLYTLNDLIKAPKFLEMNSMKWRFKQFKSKTLPKPWEYESKGGHLGYFQMEYYQERKKRKNISQYVEDHAHLAALQDRLVESMAIFDMAW